MKALIFICLICAARAEVIDGLGWSMAPTFPHHSKLELTRPNASPYVLLLPGRIVLRAGCIGSTNAIGHRLMRYHPGWYLFGHLIGEGWETKGDNPRCPIDPGLMTEKTYLGTLTLIP